MTVALLLVRTVDDVCRHINVSRQLILDQLFEHEAQPVQQLFSQQSSAPLYPPSSFWVNLFVIYLVLTLEKQIIPRV